MRSIYSIFCYTKSIQMWYNMSFWLIFATSVLVGTILLFSEDHIRNGKEISKDQHIKKAGAVKFCDRIVEPEDEQKFSQRSHVIIREFGKKYTTMVLSVHKAQVELFWFTRSDIFLKAVADENEIREREELGPIEVFLHIPIKLFEEWNSLTVLQTLAMGLANYIANDGIISGVVFEATLIQAPFPMKCGAPGKEMNMSSTVVKFKKLLNSLQLTFGHSLKMGLALNSKECTTSLVSELGEVISSFDMVFLDIPFMEYSGASCQEVEEQDAAYFDNWLVLSSRN